MEKIPGRIFNTWAYFHQQSGYLYKCTSKRFFPKLYLTCVDSECPGRGIYAKGQEFRETTDHNHLPNPEDVKECRCLGAMRERVATENVPISVIFEEEQKRYGTHMFFISQERSLQRIRQRNNGTYPTSNKKLKRAGPGRKLNKMRWYRQFQEETAISPAQENEDQGAGRLAHISDAAHSSRIVNLSGSRRKLRKIKPRQTDYKGNYKGSLIRPLSDISGAYQRQATTDNPGPSTEPDVTSHEYEMQSNQSGMGISNSHILTVSCANHHKFLIDKLLEFLHSNHKTDMKFFGGGQVRQAHQILVDMFMSQDKLIETAIETDSDTIDSLLEFMYTGTVNMHCDNLNGLMELADKLDFGMLVDAIESTKRKIQLTATEDLQPKIMDVRCLDPHAPVCHFTPDVLYVVETNEHIDIEMEENYSEARESEVAHCPEQEVQCDSNVIPLLDSVTQVDQSNDAPGGLEIQSETEPADNLVPSDENSESNVACDENGEYYISESGVNDHAYDTVSISVKSTPTASDRPKENPHHKRCPPNSIGVDEPGSDSGASSGAESDSDWKKSTPCMRSNSSVRRDGLRSHSKKGNVLSDQIEIRILEND